MLLRSCSERPISKSNSFFLVRRQAEHRGAAAHALFVVTAEDFIFGAMRQQAVDPQAEQAFNQRAGGVGVGLEQVAGIAVFLKGGVAMQRAFPLGA